VTCSANWLWRSISSESASKLWALFTAV